MTIEFTSYRPVSTITPTQGRWVALYRDDHEWWELDVIGWALYKTFYHQGHKKPKFDGNLICGVVIIDHCASCAEDSNVFQGYFQTAKEIDDYKKEIERAETKPAE